MSKLSSLFHNVEHSLNKINELLKVCADLSNGNAFKVAVSRYTNCDSYFRQMKLERKSSRKLWGNDLQTV